ncbi:M20 family metallopeptidase [Desulfopila inferna]|uniref:M20 family metallopeptidase n=1 Tax=Desulfopila inferna TaxID=468528 RepID=UPI0019659FC0|nr:M20 family metallopeptidase [Desulfopila inferna]MBM9606194.1 M20 family metallopeptidase [Desulfopila inferna]
MNIESLLYSVKQAEVVQVCQELVKLKSVNPPGDELQVAEYVASFLEKAGLKVELVSHSPTRASVLARLKGSGEKPALLFNSHLDTVPVGNEKWKHDPFGGVVAEKKIWGRGAADMKGGLAAMLMAAKIISEAQIPLQGDLVLAATAGEEVDSTGAIAIAGRKDLGPMQAMMIPEPSSNDVFTAEKGALWLEITTKGKTAHGSMPEEGHNAVMRMIYLINELQKQNFDFKEHPLLGGFSQSINTINGGVKTNVVPDYCVVTVDIRTVPGQGHQEIVRRVENLITELSRKDPELDATVRVTNDRIPVETLPDEPLVQKFLDVVAEVTGKRTAPKGARYYTDGAAFVPVLKIPMIICGPGDAKLAHQPNEFVEVAKLVESVKIYTLAAAKFLL